MSANKWFEFDGLYRNSTSKPSDSDPKTLDPKNNGFQVNGELPDPEGKGVLGVDPAGRPILQSLWGSTFMDLPYELNLGWKTGRGLPSGSGAPDNPFSVNELERILRPYDRDAASLPARLAALTFDPAQNKSALINKRQEVTTESWDVPVTSPALPPHILTRVQSDLAAGNITADQIPWLPPHHVTDLLKAYYYYQLVTAGGMAPAAAATQANNMVNALTTAQLVQLFPPEMLAGLRMNINRPFPGPGNGSTNDSSAYGMAALWQSLGVGGSYGDFWFGQMPEFPDANDDVGNYFPNVDLPHISAIQFPARQLYARYLYVLALLLRDKNPPPATLDPQAQWFTETLTDVRKEELAKRRIAQWAINAACFKTNDSIMAAFEYDTDPLGYTGTAINGWRVDGIIGTNPSTSSSDDSLGHRCLVWGCKPPELILTETLAFHDRRSADTPWDDGLHKIIGPNPTDDTNFDQTRVPQGSAFFELYCPRDFHGSTPPSDLYTNNAGTWYLDLGRMAPAGSGAPAYPVWRIVISESTIKNPHDNDIDYWVNYPYKVRDPITGSYLNNANPYPDRISFEPEQYHGQATTLSLLKSDTALTAKATIDRIVWFSTHAPTSQYDHDRIYYNYAGTSTWLERGHYAIVGPRKETTLGLVKLAPTDPDLANYPLGVPSSQKITIPTAANPTAPVTYINGTPDAKISTAGGLIDTNKIKMPLGIIVGNTPSGWSTPVGISISEPLFSSPGYYQPEPTIAGTDKYAVSDVFGNPVKEWYGDPKEKDTTEYFRNTPFEDPTTTNTQRPLQDPSENLPYQGTVTNYKTVFLQRLANPSAPYDPAANPYLTVDWMPIDLTIFNGETDPRLQPWLPSPGIPEATKNTPKFAARQRGTTTSADFNIWKPESDDLDNSVRAGTNAYFDYNLVHSLGYLNQAFQNSTAPYWITSASGMQAELYGDPSVKPFPWLPWFGRPYVNQLELMLVPGSHPARLLWEFKPCSSSTNNYTPGDIASAPFPQLLNFLQSGNTNGMNQFGRIMDYVGVPSWYAGTEIQANPNTISPSGVPASPGTHVFFPPYNKISTYREPGRINLNTIYSPDVFNGLLNGNTSPTWAQFVQNRRGYGPIDNNVLYMDSMHPTEFNSPFRSGGSVYWNPLFSYSSPTPGINSTYLRQDTTATANPLFQQYPATQQDVTNTDRNPFFHYQGLERLGNLVTTRSNVYAIWITVGYFEVKPNRFTTPAGLPDDSHPDGYELGQEMGSDTGEIVRHRAFYMIDRTIPVGFQRGQDLNVEKAIILKRFIE